MTRSPRQPVVNNQVDMRGFQHALEPLTKRQQWQLDALHAKLGQAQQALTVARTQLEELEAQQKRQATLAAQAAGQRFDPLAHRRTLGYLANLQRQAHNQREALLCLQQQREALQSEYLVCQQKLELLQVHRDEARQAYATDAMQRQAAEADSDWLSRVQWHDRQREDMANEAQP